MLRVTVLAVLLLAPLVNSLDAACRNLVVTTPNDPTLTDKLIGLIGPASHVVAFIGIVKESPRVAAVAEGAAFAKEVYDYVNRLSPQERQNLQVCDEPPRGLNSSLGANKTVLIGTKNDLNTLFTAPPSRLVPIQNDFTSLGMQMALQPRRLGDYGSLKVTPIFGSVSGVVKGSDGLPMAGVVVWLLKEDGSGADHKITDSSGTFTFSAFPGKYVLATYTEHYRGWSVHLETLAGGRSPWDIHLER